LRDAQRRNGVDFDKPDRLRRAIGGHGELGIESTQNTVFDINDVMWAPAMVRRLLITVVVAVGVAVARGGVAHWLVLEAAAERSSCCRLTLIA
jgi:hypothetical protein